MVARFHQSLDKFCILSNKVFDPRLLVGNETRDDAAVYDIGNGVGIISTTDFYADR